MRRRKRTLNTVDARTGSLSSPVQSLAMLLTARKVVHAQHAALHARSVVVREEEKENVEHCRREDWQSV